MLPLLRPKANLKMGIRLLEVLESDWWGKGPEVAALEKEFAEKVDAKHAIAVSSGTAALDLCVKALRKKYDSPSLNLRSNFTRLITTPMTFISDSWIASQNGLELLFSDIEEDSLCLDPRALCNADGRSIIVVVNSHGRLCNIPRIKEIYPNTPVIEDCAHSMHTPGAGTRGDMSIWSFQAVKTLPAGDGGMVTTNDDELAEIVRGMTWLGIKASTYDRARGKGYSWDYDVTEDGIKAYMNDLTAVLVREGLKEIDKWTERRRKIQARYNEAFQGLLGVKIPAFSHTVQYYTLRTDKRDLVHEKLREVGISTSVHFKPLNKMTIYKDTPGPTPVSDRIWPELLSLPCHNAMTDDDIRFVIEEFWKAVK